MGNEPACQGAGPARVVNDAFASLSSMWSENKSSRSVSSGRVSVDTLPPMEGGIQPPAVLYGPAVVEDVTLEALFKLPSSGDKGGIVFSKNGPYWGVQVTTGSTNNIHLYAFGSDGSMGYSRAQASATINANTDYTLRVRRMHPANSCNSLKPPTLRAPGRL